jgi:uncharacterized UBP type Zn finger protein
MRWFTLSFLTVLAKIPTLFTNPGNFCYRNAALQILLRLDTVNFCHLIVTKPEGQPMTFLLCQLQDVINRHDSLLDLTAFSEKLPEPWNRSSQQDPSEFLLALYAKLAEENSNLRFEIPISDRTIAHLSATLDEFFAFSVGVRETRSCAICSRQVWQILSGQPLTLSLKRPLHNKYEVIELAELLADTKEVLEAECEYCKDAVEGLMAIAAERIGVIPKFRGKLFLNREIVEYPRVAMIQLPRFKFNPVKMEFTRLKNLISAPLRGMRLLPDSTRDQPTYHLVGVVEHFGRTHERGHYMAKVLIDDDWWKIDDTPVSAKVINEDEVVTKNAYLLFYRSDT